MKEKLSRKFFGKFGAGFLAIALIMAGVLFVGNGSSEVFASDTTKDFIAEEVTDISTYRSENSYTYPKPTTEGKQDYLFAGWYEDAACSTAYTSSTIASATSAYAKYVPAETMDVKFQVSTGTTAQSITTDLRMVSTVDSTNYKKVGYSITANNKTLVTETKNVYQKIESTTEGLEYGYSPVVFDIDSEYFVTFTIKNIKNANFERTYSVQPYWVTLDGTTVYGCGRNVRVSDSYNKIANVPVRIYADNVEAGNAITVTYDSTKFTYLGFEAGTVAAGVSVTDNGNGTITCTVSQPIADANGMLVNLRLQMTDKVSSNNTFKMTGTGACNYVYKVFSTYYDGTPDTSWYDDGKSEFVIATAADLYGFAGIVNRDGASVNNYGDNFWTKTVYLGADITINEGGVNLDEANGWSTSSPHNWVPIAKIGSSYQFKGTFNGLGHTISGVYFKTEDDIDAYYGLFGRANSDSTLTNFRISESYMERTKSAKATDKQALLGSVAGQVEGQMSSVYSEATIVTHDSTTAGGMIGRINPSNASKTQTIDDCCFAGEVYVTSSATSNKERKLQVGGIAGYAFNVGTTNVTNCHNKGIVTCVYSATGSEASAVGGIIGNIGHNASYYVNITNCMSSGAIKVQFKVTDNGTGETTTTDYSGGVASIVGYNENQGHIADGQKVAHVVCKNTIGTTTSHENGWKQTSNAECKFDNSEIAKNDNNYYSGYEAYNRASRLGIYSNAANENGKWVLKEDGIPTLKTFADEWIDLGWYYNNKTDGADTFVIETAEELYSFSCVSQKDTFAKDTVELGADIKMNSGVASYWAEGTATPARRFVPIGKGASGATASAFAGTFDGKGHEVSGIYVNETANASNGFFGQSKGIIKDFKLTNSYIVNNTGTHNTGAIVGNMRGGTVSGVYSDAIVKTLQSASMSTGGIVGIMSGGTEVSSAWFEGKVDSQGYYAGGIVGRVLSGSPIIENCISNGVVNSTYINTSGKETTSAFVGGIIGATHGATAATIKNCLNMSQITTSEDDGSVGSVVGRAYNVETTFENVYTTQKLDGGKITGLGNTVANTKKISGEPVMISVEDLTGENAYIYTDFDFAATWGVVKDGMPVLQSLYDGTLVTKLDAQRVSRDWYYNKTSYAANKLTQETTKFTIQDADDFYGLSKLVNGGNTFKNQTVQLVADGDFDLNPSYTVTVDKEKGTVTTNGSANKWTPIGTSDTILFDGTFDGNKNTIKGLYVNATSGRVGLFGSTGANSLVKNFIIDNSYYTSSTVNVGGVAGISSGNFDNIYLTDSVGIISIYNSDDNGRAAGIVGYWQGSNTATISNCWFDGYVSAYRRYASGIVGQIYNGTKTIENCLFTGKVEGKSDKAMFHGGLAGAIMGSTSVSPTVYLKDSVVAGTVKAMSANAVGSVVGRAITNGQGKNSSKVYLYVENVYTTDNLVLADSVTPLSNNGYRMNGCGDLTTQYNYTFGEPMLVETSELAGVEGYINTNLDFASKWVVTNDFPKLAAFAEADVTDFADVQRISISWYYNACKYDLNHLDTTNKKAEQLATEYEIADAADMYGFAAIVNGGADLFVGKTVKLVNDIVFNNVTTGNEAAGWADGSITAPTTSWVPIGTVNGDAAVHAFQGTFDGQDHTISGIYTSSSEQYLGLFRKIQDATICNLRLENSYFNSEIAAGGNSMMGSIAGGGDGTLKNIYSNAILHGSRIVGGLIGRVSQSSNSNTKLEVTSCWFDGIVDIDYKGASRIYSGGLVGYPVHGNVFIDTCLYTGTIDLDINYTGTGGTFGPQVGGICSGDNGDSASHVETKNTVSAGEIHATVLTCEKNPELTYIGSVYGDVRHASSSAENTYGLTMMTDTKESTGVTSTRTAVSYSSNKKCASVNVDNSFMGNPEAIYGYGAQMWTGLSFTEADRIAADNALLEEGAEEITVAGPIWAAVEGQLPVPATLAEHALEMIVGKPDTEWAGSGKEADPYLITTVEELAGFAKLSKTKTFAGEFVALGNDIIINEGELAADWAEDKASPTLPWYITIGTAADGKRFEGTFDGKNHTISGICLQDTATYMGLFAAIEVGSTVKNLRLENSYFEQEGDGFTGSIVGDCRGTISNVYSDAIIESGYQQVGGIVGRANGYSYVNHKNKEESRISGTIENCWYNGDIILGESGRYSGGIIGIVIQGEWTLNNCVFTGTITSEYTGTDYVDIGGICGALSAPASISTSEMETKLTLESCISAGTIKTANKDKSAGAILGRARASIGFDSTTDETTGITTKVFKELRETHLVMNNVFATREAGYQEVGVIDSSTGSDSKGNSYGVEATVWGQAVWTNNADRLIGYCIEEVKGVYYVGGSLDFTSNFVIREEGVPVPSSFADMSIVTPITNVDTILALKTMDVAWSAKNAVNYGLGHYILKATGKTYEEYATYLTALQGQGFTSYIGLDKTGTDGVYDVIYTKAEGEWVLNVLYSANSKEVTLTISNGLDSLSPNLEPETSTTEGTVSLSMVQLTGYGSEDTYYYGNSFVFKLPNGHFLINDGGGLKDFTGLISHLKSLAEISEEDKTTKIIVDAWTVTHQHADHFNVIRGFMENADAIDQVRVKAFYINEPNRKAMLAYVSETDLFDSVKLQYRVMRMMKDENGNTPKVYWCQTGQKYYFNGITMDVIQSQEQIPVGNYGKRNAYGKDGSDYNTCSTSMVFTTANEKKIFITGDSNYVNMKCIMEIYGSAPTTLSGINIYQAPHHGKNTSMNISAPVDNTFTNYLANLTSTGKFDVTLFPCSLIYGIDYKDLTVFPQAGNANNNLIKTATDSYYHYGDGTKTFILGETITKVE